MTLRLSLGAALAGILAAALGLIALGSSSATEANGVLSLDAVNTGNTASAVGTIEDSNTITDTCGAAGGILVQVTLGNENSSDATGASGGIPSNRDVGGWSVEVHFDPTKLTFTGHTFNTSAAGVGFFMEKASDRDDDIGQNNHIGVSNATVPGVVVVGSTVLETPPGAQGVGRLDQLIFDCVGAGAIPHSACLSIDYTGFEAVPPGDTFFVGNTTEQTTGNHNFIPGNQHVALGINGGAVPTCPPATPTPSPTPGPQDSDGDGVLDAADNCPTVPNAGGQLADIDGDQAGDACDGPGSGNVDCSASPNGVTSVDSLKVLRHSAGLSVAQSEPCLNIGQTRLLAPPGDWKMGDVNCSAGGTPVNSVDALLILRAVAGLPPPANPPVGCPAIKP